MVLAADPEARGRVVLAADPEAEVAVQSSRNHRPILCPYCSPLTARSHPPGDVPRAVPRGPRAMTHAMRQQRRI